MKCPYCIKVCSKCKKILVAWEGNFRRGKKGKYGFKSQCKECDKIHRIEHQEEIKRKRKQYYEKHREEILEKTKQYKEKHRDFYLKYYRQYYEEHKEELLEKNKQYKMNNPHIYVNAHNKRRIKEENQGRGITSEQWYEMFCFFDWCCAYSGEYLGGDNADRRRTIDHIICLDNGGLNEIWNCVPMFSNYNKQKQTSDMLDWYKQQPYFSEERLMKIYAWCEYAYEKWNYKKRRKGNKKIKFS